MNLFYVDADPTVAAQSLGDKHVVKMILETAQMLSTAHRILDGKQEVIEVTKRKIKKLKSGEVIDLGYITRKKKIWKLDDKIDNDKMYKATHINHPSSIWIRQSAVNYFWAYDHFVALCNEYTRRYGKIHLTDRKLSTLLIIEPLNIPRGNENSHTLPPCCMPDEYKITDCPVTNYRYYYAFAKTKMHKWTNRQPPEWIKESLHEPIQEY